MNMLKKLTVLLVVGSLALSGCATIKSEDAFDKASAGMSKHDVMKMVGRPAVVRGALKNDFGQRVEVWEYRVGPDKSVVQFLGDIALAGITLGSAAPLIVSSNDTDRYWFYFVDGKFVTWSRAGDWARDVSKIREMKLTPAVSLSHII